MKKEGVDLLVMLMCASVTTTVGALSVLGSADSAFSSKQAPSSHSIKILGNKGALPSYSYRRPNISSSLGYPSTKGPHPHNAIRPSSIALAPSETPARIWLHGPAYSPSISNHKLHGPGRNRVKLPQHSLDGRPVPPSPFMSWSSAVPASSPASKFTIRAHPPAMSPLDSLVKKIKATPPTQILSLPPPPPNEDCTSVTCSEPLTYTAAGSPCGCVWPIQVKLQFSIPIYTFFTLVTELAEEIAASVALKHSQVRIMGANEAGKEPVESIVLINLVPRVKFNDSSAFSIYKKFWNRQVLTKPSVFGTYEVLYVRYPGLPPSPPSPESISTVDDGPYSGHGNNGRTNKPLGVDVPRRKQNVIGGNMITVIVLSSFTAFGICMAVALFLLLKCGIRFHKPQQLPQQSLSSQVKASGTSGPMIFGSMPFSRSMSLNSGAMTSTGSATTFTFNDLERATNSFDASRILGEGGFGLVFSGLFDNGREVAVKVLKRDDHHGSRELLAEIEMLSRLHHRNLVKLIGICTEGHARCLVYELIPNGSVESHLHGDDMETHPLDWDARMKIALGAARGLAYLHEDSSPCVIHRDFKSSNILLEHDFTPKVSDFGLAREAMDGGNKRTSTHVMGTFGYLAPEYAMTGHLLVKSDVYSYGVVLLELLTGRKPVDLSQPPGEENLVAYARPLLTCKEGLETIIDPTVKSSVSFDIIAKVAVIASMCVQSEVSHRPFMGEVVQALKLVCNEFDEAVQGSKSCSHENLLVASDRNIGKVSGELAVPSAQALSTSDLIMKSMGPEGSEFGSFRRDSSSGPLRTGTRRHF